MCIVIPTATTKKKMKICNQHTPRDELKWNTKTYPKVWGWGQRGRMGQREKPEE